MSSVSDAVAPPVKGNGLLESTAGIDMDEIGIAKSIEQQTPAVISRIEMLCSVFTYILNYGCFKPQMFCSQMILTTDVMAKVLSCVFYIHFNPHFILKASKTKHGLEL